MASLILCNNSLCDIISPTKSVANKPQIARIHDICVNTRVDHKLGPILSESITKMPRDGGISPVSSDAGGYSDREDDFFILDSGDDFTKWVCAPRTVRVIHPDQPNRIRTTNNTNTAVPAPMNLSRHLFAIVGLTQAPTTSRMQPKT